MGDAGSPDEIWTFDQLLCHRTIDADQTPLLAYPKSLHGVTDYEPITGAALNRFVDEAAKCLLELGFNPVVGIVPASIKTLPIKTSPDKNNSMTRQWLVSTHQVISTMSSMFLLLAD
jgi:hypothetical protein